MKNSDVDNGIHYPSNSVKRSRGENLFADSSFSSKRSKKFDPDSGIRKVSVAWVDLKQLVDGEDASNHDAGEGTICRGSPLVYSSTGCPCRSICVEVDRLYTIGRRPTQCQFVFNDPCVSRQHCQIFLDASKRKLCLLDGVLSPWEGVGRILEDLRKRTLSLGTDGKMEEEKDNEKDLNARKSRFKSSLNGVYVNGFRVGNGSISELSAGDKVTLVCKDKHGDIGFLIKRIIFQEEVIELKSDGFILDRPLISSFMSTGKVNKRISAFKRSDILSGERGSQDLVGRATSLLTCCRVIRQSDDPISSILQCSKFSQLDSTYACSSKMKGDKSSAALPKPELVPGCAVVPLKQRITSHLHEQASVGIGCNNTLEWKKCDFPSSKSKDWKSPLSYDGIETNCEDKFAPPPGKRFFLNRLESMLPSSFGEDGIVSLRDLLYPVKSISKMFIATFTNDILWFLSYCKIPSHLPVTIVCHDTVHCWSTDPASRCSAPYPDFPNLAVVYPPFPEAIAFGQDSRRQGIACHHPKLMVLQREESIRVVITSANLVERQWNSVTNTVWWQDFPCKNTADYSSVFTQIHDASGSIPSSSDFAAQLAGFMARLLVDVPSQAHWITELTKYDFSGAKAYLIPSVPGIYTCKAHLMTQNLQYLYANQLKSGSAAKLFLGSAEASVVGLSYLYRRAVDSSGTQLKKLASFLTNSWGKVYGMSKVILRRNKNVIADANAVSVHVPNPKDLSEQDCAQLGFLPRNVAKWVSPLWDVGFFRFTGYIWPKQALASAIEGNGMKVQLILHISQGPMFEEMPKGMQDEHVVAFCSLIASLQRSTGLWRLEEVLGRYKWPEHLETDFMYGASSIGGSVNSQFLAAFSSAAGKKSLEYFDSEESDPEWGCWNASHELRKPSIKVVYPTIERARVGSNGVLGSKFILCFTERTWKRLKTTNILHDSVPNPPERAGHPMHTKVARRCFRYKEGGPSFGWVYCGSHNFSAAAWGRLISAPSSVHTNSKQQQESAEKWSGGSRLHVCNYELGVVFVFPPGESEEVDTSDNMDNISLPYMVPPPQYSRGDRPATAQAMREVLANNKYREQQAALVAEEGMVGEEDEEEIIGEEGMEGAGCCDAKEMEEEKAYAEMLWCGSVDM